MLRRVSALALALLAPMPAWAAGANDTRACDAAYETAQTLRDAGKLLAARDQLRVCARAACPTFMVKECTGWLSEVETRIPSVILVAADTSGAALPNVKVAMDGEKVLRNVDGTAWDIDPGQHSLTFAMGDGTKVDRTAIVVEGRKEQLITITLGTRMATPRFPYRPVGYAAGGLGLVGIVIGSIFGAEALSTKSNHCNGTACTSGAATTALDEGTISTVGFVAGGILVAGGLALALFAPPKTNAHATQIQAAPLVAGGVEGVMLRGRWW